MRNQALVLHLDSDRFASAIDSIPVIQPDIDEVLVRISYSTLNYKDALAITNQAPIIRQFPMTPGIDFAGVVEDSRSANWKPGDKVLLNGWKVGESFPGGLAQYCTVKGDWLLPQPDGLSDWECMALGTAGYTAALCVLALQAHGLKTGDPVVVSGAAGGVGSIAVHLLSKLGLKVTALTGRPEEASYFEALGASEVMARESLLGPLKPLQKETWVAGVDTVGSSILANMLGKIRYGGAVAACGLAGGMDLPASVAPFILRNISLIGVDSVMTPIEKRKAAWKLLADVLDPNLLPSIASTISLADCPAMATKILSGQVRGRLVVSLP